MPRAYLGALSLLSPGGVTPSPVPHRVLPFPERITFIPPVLSLIVVCVVSVLFIVVIERDKRGRSHASGDKGIRDVQRCCVMELILMTGAGVVVSTLSSVTLDNSCPLLEPQLLPL